MASLNQWAGIGNLTRDPEVKHLPSGDSVAEVSIAINERYKTKSGEQKTSTTFVNVVMWGRMADTAGQYLKKGSAVLILGKLQMDTWEKDGKTQHRLKVRATNWQFIGGKRDSDEAREEEPDESQPPQSAGDAPAAPSDGLDDDGLPF